MPQNPLFADRTQAGEKLAQAIQNILTQQTLDSGVKPRTIVYALPRGGIPIAFPVARLLGCPLTIEVAKKISHPENPELAIGAVTASGIVLWEEQGFYRKIQPSQLKEVALNSAIEQAQFLQVQLGFACPQVDAKGATLILVDDGIATGMTMAVAAKSLRELNPAEIWLCSPVAPLKLLPWLHQWGDRLIVLATPKNFLSVSHFYSEFPQVKTQEVLELLKIIKNDENS
ncbi:phosphoribosyltransferase [Scytonema sp. UIC 10036]|uniref:phosphoribosyltransferase n=1 Tax=Scytonema sp. UIC 10036 TaxID=2304196 RepID=UPI0012DA8C3B|nr:phosphoribosyltransferase family protein [Scytonema sp. UIC 10036]MUH01383.1 phosphoribosyltransferase [Scytonema sp. UIC 10036]